MNPQIISIVLSTAGPVIFIILLLLVSGAIGYLTAWFYAKSVYNPVIKRLEDEKVQLNKQITGLKDDVSKLNKSVDGLNDKVKKLEADLKGKEAEIMELKNTEKSK